MLFPHPFPSPFGAPFPQPFGAPGGATLPRELLLLYTRNGLLDTIGTHDGIPQLAQYGLFATGDYLTGDIAAGTTVVGDHGGDGEITLTENQLDYTSTKKLYDFELSNGSIYKFAIKLSDTSAVWPDVSGNGRNLVLANDTAVDADSHCVESIVEGSDWLNEMGWTVADGTQYLEDALTTAFPVGVIIPALADSSGCCAFDNGGIVEIQSEVVDFLPDSSGIWTTHQRPVSIHDNGVTYFCGVKNDGVVYIAAYDHATGQTASTDLAFTSVDDHNNPSMMVLPDGKICAFWCKHNDSSIKWAVSVNPNDISSFGSTKTISLASVSYPQPVGPMPNGDYWLFYRRQWASGDGGVGMNTTQRVWAYSVSTDNLATFTEVGPLWFSSDVNSPYTEPKLITQSDDSVHIHFVRSDWMYGASSYVRKDVQYCYYDSTTDAFHSADGTELVSRSSLPITDRDTLDRVYDTDIEGKYAFATDVNIDGSTGDICITFTTLTDGTYVNYANYARYTTAWSHAEIVEIGYDFVDVSTVQPAYNGGIALGVDLSTVYLGREVTTGSGVWSIEKWETDDNGLTWGMVHGVSEYGTSQPAKVFRPKVPVNAHANMPVLWSGSNMYNDYDDFSSKIFGLFARDDLTVTPVEAYQNIIVNSTYVDEDITDYILLVDLGELATDGDNLFDTCRTDGGDIRFTLDDGTTYLPRAIFNFDRTTKTGWAWVRIPLLSSSVNTIIRCYYNGVTTSPVAPDPSSPDYLYPGDYVFASHMYNTPSGPINEITGDGFSAIGTEVAGDIGKAMSYSRGDSDSSGDATAITVPTTTSESFTAIMYTNPVDNIYDSNLMGTGIHNGWYMRVEENDSASPGTLMIKADDGTNDAYDHGTTVVTGAYHLLAMRLDRTQETLEGFVDGVKEISGLSTAAIGEMDLAHKFRVAGVNSGLPVKATIDEVLLIKTALSDGHIATIWNNYNKAVNFYSVS